MGGGGGIFLSKNVFKVGLYNIFFDFDDVFCVAPSLHDILFCFWFYCHMIAFTAFRFFCFFFCGRCGGGKFSSPFPPDKICGSAKTSFHREWRDPCFFNFLFFRYC